MAEEEIKPIYANVVKIAATPFDTTFDFGYRSPEQTSKDFNPLTRIIMSHSHAKAMLPILASLIAKLEKEIGPIPAPGFKDEGEEQ